MELDYYNSKHKINKRFNIFSTVLLVLIFFYTVLTPGIRYFDKKFQDVENKNNEILFEFLKYMNELIIIENQLTILTTETDIILRNIYPEINSNRSTSVKLEKIREIITSLDSLRKIRFDINKNNKFNTHLNSYILTNQDINQIKNDISNSSNVNEQVFKLSNDTVVNKENIEVEEK